MSDSFQDILVEDNKSSKFAPSWKLIWQVFVIVVILSVSFYFIQFYKANTEKTVDDKLTQLKELRADKKSREEVIEEQKKAIYVLDQKIIPLKCEIYSEVGAKDTWESECRDSFENQQSEIINQVSSQLKSEVIPEYQ